jgi:hypothetical protein
MSSRLEGNKNIVTASEALFTQLEVWMENCNLHPDEIAQELSYYFSGMWNRAEGMATKVKKIKGTKPTKE